MWMSGPTVAFDHLAGTKGSDGRGSRGLGLHRFEHRQRLGTVQRPALPLTGDVPRPEQGLGLHVLQRGEGPPAPVRVSDIGHGLLDPGLVLRLRGTGRVHQRAVVGGEFGVRIVDPRVVEVRLVHPGHQVVRHQTPRDTAEEAERLRVRFGRGVLVHVCHRAETNMCREAGSTITNAEIRCRFPVAGLIHCPRKP